MKGFHESYFKTFLLGFERLFLSDFVLWKLDNAIFWVRVIIFLSKKIILRFKKSSSIRKWSIMVVKLIRAHSGCLGIRRRWRTRQTAICFGEQQVCFDPEISEWGDSLASASILEWIHSSREVNPVNWNILVAGGIERKQSITLVVASETVIAQTSFRTGVVGHYTWSYKSIV